MIKLCAILSRVTVSRHPAPSCLGRDSPLGSARPSCLSRRGHRGGQTNSSGCCWGCAPAQVAFSSPDAPRRQSSDARNSSIPQSASFQWRGRVLDLMRKENNHMQRVLTPTVRMSPLPVRLWSRKRTFMLVVCWLLKLQNLQPWYMISTQGRQKSLSCFERETTFTQLLLKYTTVTVLLLNHL